MKLPEKFYKSNPLYLIALFVVIGSAVSNRILTATLRNDPSTKEVKTTAEIVKTAQSDLLSAVIPSPNANGFLPDDPKKYGMTTQRQYGLPTTQEQWDDITRKTLDDSSAKEKIETQKAFLGHTLSSQEYQERLSWVDQQITEYEKKIKAEPLNSASSQKLQNLYMLKSTLTNLREEVVKQ